MIDRIAASKVENPGEQAFAFIRARIQIAEPDVEKDVELLLEKGVLRHIFNALIDRLADARTRYPDIAALRYDDSLAKQSAGNLLPEETASQDFILRRPNRGKPSRLEYFFLKLLHEDEWKTLCNEFPEVGSDVSEIKKLGVLSVRDVLETVLSDEPRIKKFVRAVQERVRATGRAPISIFNIGCGPFPILAIAAALASPRASITCIEINPLSAKIANLVVRKLRLDDRIHIAQGDATTDKLPEQGSIDLLISETGAKGLFDPEQSTMLPRYASRLNPRKGSTIPSRVYLSIGLTPTSYKETLKNDTTHTHVLVLDTTGDEILVQPDDAWHARTGNTGVELARFRGISRIQTSIPIPEHVSLKKLSEDFTLDVSVEFDLDADGKHALRRYECGWTTPFSIGFITVPPELMDVDPKNLEIQISYEDNPRTHASVPKAKVVRKES